MDMLEARRVFPHRRDFEILESFSCGPPTTCTRERRALTLTLRLFSRIPRPTHGDAPKSVEHRHGEWGL